MNRLMENTVFSGFVMACRLATWPTRISPSFVKATTEGVRRLPSWFGDHGGVAAFHHRDDGVRRPEVDADHLRHVRLSFLLVGATARRGPAGRGPSARPLQNVDLDLARLDLFRLRQRDLEHAVTVGGLHLVAPARRSAAGSSARTGRRRARRAGPCCPGLLRAPAPSAALP